MTVQEAIIQLANLHHKILHNTSFASEVTESEIQALVIAKQLLEQPKADWIPCEVELPPQPNENPLYENKPLQVYLVSVKNCEEPFRAFWNGKNFTDGWSKLNVEAWMELPQPYKKEGAE